MKKPLKVIRVDTSPEAARELKRVVSCFSHVEEADDLCYIVVDNNGFDEHIIADYVIIRPGKKPKFFTYSEFHERYNIIEDD